MATSIPISPGAPAPPMVLVSWDGKSTPLSCVHLDARPDFTWVLFDYSGTQRPGSREFRGLAVELLSVATECKGEIYSHFADHLAKSHAVPEYVALIDDDVVVSVSQINQALFLGRNVSLDVFSPTLFHDSNYSHDWTLQQPGRAYRMVDWVEVMMPFYRGELFIAGREHYRGNISAWGIDSYLIPLLQQQLGCTQTALLDAIAVSHRRPITSGSGVYRNGMTAEQEMRAMKVYCLHHIDTHMPELRGTDWFKRIFPVQLGKRRPLERLRHYFWNVLRKCGVGRVDQD